MYKTIIFILLIFIFFFFSASIVFATNYACTCEDNRKNILEVYAECQTFCNISPIKSWVIVHDSSGSGSVELDNPLKKITDVPTLVGKVINAVLGIVGSLALVIFIYGGFVWMTAAGNMEKVTTGKNVLIWATIGLVVIFASYAIVSFIIFEGIAAP